MLKEVLSVSAHAPRILFPDEKAAYKRSVRDSDAAARRFCDRLLVCGADAAESRRNHIAGEAGKRHIGNRACAGAGAEGWIPA